ncbi:hypothetical protein QC763_610040 [Podospora pseudopauciseta]|uniref:4-coumarate--CoA ligase n=1 Tax=Podospora pseudopauciseta TaxID=2093780 RepID=A0ABR0H6U2_9PEZI|nr:hypothetical protein QC763_610040 [Podospora pseudopauciseta]
MALTTAYSGAPAGRMPFDNAFGFTFSQPFQHESDFTPANHRVPKVNDEQPIFVDNKSGRALTYSQIRADSLALASGLLSLPNLDPTEIKKLPPTPSCPQGPEIAPVVLIQLPNCLPFAPILLGTFASGFTATLVSPALTADEVAWILQNAKPRVIITATACLEAMKAAIGKQEGDRSFWNGVPVFTVDAVNDTYPLAFSGQSNPQDWRQLLQAKRKPSVQPNQRLNEQQAKARTAVILWSSGTSGRSKGVLLSHHALNFASASLWHDADYYPPSGPQRWLGFAPFYHVFGLCNVFLLGIAAGARVFIMQGFKLPDMLEGIRKRQITYVHMSPPVAVMLAKAEVVEEYAKRDPKTGRNGFSSVVGAVTGGAPLGHEVVVQVYKRCGFRIRLGYGLSETCSTALQRGLGEREMGEQAGDTGLPHWGVEVMIASGEGYATKEGEKTPAAGVDVEGEVLVKAPGLMSAYLPVGLFLGAKPDMSVTNEALTADGWFRTGDVGALCKAGRLRITDRLKELIKVRAYQVAPAELEAVLCSSESVGDAGVVGVYDDDEATEWPRAFVVPAGGKGNKSRADLEKLAVELKELVEKRTAKYKWLVGGIVFIDQVPKSPSGKILRRLLKSGAEGTKGVEIKLYEKKKRSAKL